MNLQSRIDNLFEQMIYLCEIRGALDNDTNNKTEQKISEIKEELAQLKRLNAVVNSSGAE